MTLKRFFVILIIIQLSGILAGQSTITIKGHIEATSGKPIEMVNILVTGQNRGTTTGSDGTFEVKAETLFPIHLQFSHIDYRPKAIIINDPDEASDSLKIQLYLQNRQLREVKVSGQNNTDHSAQKIDPLISKKLPMPSGYAIEGLVRSQMGVSSGNELSTQYRVRGGNFDENLVYINGIEVYRPMLIRSGQQEGLSIVNPDLVESVFFSAGGFGVKYGDKMSSVLDIRYKKPERASASANINLMGARAHVQGQTRNKKLSWIGGYRHKTNRYLLGTLDTKGKYDPTFSDIQTFLSYRMTDKLSLEGFAYYALNRYHFEPTDRETTFGTLSDVKRLKVYFGGQEKDRFETGMGAVKLNFTPAPGNHLELAVSHYRAFEEEGYDIEGAYWLQDIVEVDDTESATNIGVGEYLQHARNDLLGTVTTASAKGIHPLNPNNRLEWGLNWQREHFSDQLDEWEMILSEGYSLPRNEDKLELNYSRKAQNKRNTNRLSAYIAHQATLNTSWAKIDLNYGTRLLFSNTKESLLLTPRLQIMFLPVASAHTRYRLSGGWYYQPPFYKEYRPPQSGQVPFLVSQKSIQILAGADHYFEAFERPFKFSTELYYKHFNDLIPYQVDNVRIQYTGHNEANGYSTGIDFKLHGEFVPGTDSWATLSLLKTEENLREDHFTDPAHPGNPGYIPRPTDQRVNFSLFFQDYFPQNPTFKVHLNLLFGSALPFGPPRSPRYMATNRMPPYRRVDIGFSKDLLPWLHKRYDHTRLFKDLWIGMEIFNLFNINNTISYYWVSDINKRQYAVPNYLTTRRVNLSLTVAF